MAVPLTSFPVRAALALLGVVIVLSGCTSVQRTIPGSIAQDGDTYVYIPPRPEGGGNGGGPSPGDPTAPTITAAASTVSAGGTSVVTVTATNVWYSIDVSITQGGGELTSGQILASGAASLTYQAPALVTQATQVVITAIAGEDPDATATVIITVEPAP